MAFGETLLPGWHPEQWAAAGGGSGTLTAVTATPPLTSSGGTTPNLTHDASAVAPGTYDSVTVDAKGHVSAGSNPTRVTAVTATAPIVSSGGTAPNLTHAASGVTPGAFGSTTGSALFAVDAGGHVTGGTTLPIAFPNAPAFSGCFRSLTQDSDVTTLYQATADSVTDGVGWVCDKTTIKAILRLNVEANVFSGGGAIAWRIQKQTGGTGSHTTAGTLSLGTGVLGTQDTGEIAVGFSAGDVVRVTMQPAGATTHIDFTWALYLYN